VTALGKLIRHTARFGDSRPIVCVWLFAAALMGFPISLEYQRLITERIHHHGNAATARSATSMGAAGCVGGSNN